MFYREPVRFNPSQPINNSFTAPKLNYVKTSSTKHILNKIIENKTVLAYKTNVGRDYLTL